MDKRFSRRRFLGAATGFGLFGTAAAAQPPGVSLRPVMRGEDLRLRSLPEVEEILRESGLTGRLTFAVARTDTGAWLECRNEQVGTPPASVAKAVTALYALETLGPAHRFETRLIATGGIEEGVIQGDLVLAGGADPTLDTDHLGEMVNALKAAGIKGVKGAFKVYDGALPHIRQIDPEQPYQVGYNPGISGIALNFNRVHFEWTRAESGYEVTMEGRALRYAPGVEMARMRVVDRRAPIYTYEDAEGRDNWTVARSALGKGGARWLPVRRPALYAGEICKAIADYEGLPLKQPEVVGTLPQGETLVGHLSAPLREIVQDMLKYSTNLTAEMVGLAATVRRIGMVEDLTASAAEMNRWAIDILGMKAPRLVDHSGLGDASQLTALDMARALVVVKESSLRDLMKPFLLRDEQGRPDRDHPVSVAAKTGTLNFVSGLAGYISREEGGGEELAFAIFAANDEERAGISREARERPPGARGWNARAKRVQRGLIERWSLLYGT